MKRLFLPLTGVLIVLIFMLTFYTFQAQKMESSELKKGAWTGIAAPPPSSLDNFYPPRAKEPVFLFRMIGMANFFAGIVSDLFENDSQNVKSTYEKFKAQYTEISKLVPEWEKDYPLEPVEDLGKALERGDKVKVMAAYEKVNKVCHDCHIANMANVQQKFHWGDFSRIEVKDPMINEKVSFSRLSQNLMTNFAGIIIDVEQGQSENAQKQFLGFNARFQTLKETCEDCHGIEEMTYYVDERVQALIDEMGKVLSGPSIDQKAVQTLFMRIGEESCHKCHLVHGPAALAKLQWAQMDTERLGKK